jgi:signal peptidase II
MRHWLWLSGLVIGLDQLSKWLAASLLVPYQRVPVLPSFNLTLMYNTGAAFSFLADAGGWQRWFFLLLSLAISVALVIWISRLKRGQTLLAIALSLILGGAIGNLIDRVVYGYVIDFLDFYYYAAWPHWLAGRPWPAFNLADSAITVGVVLLVIDNLFGARRRASQPTGPV